MLGLVVKAAAWEPLPQPVSGSHTELNAREASFTNSPYAAYLANAVDESALRHCERNAHVASVLQIRVELLLQHPCAEYAVNSRGAMHEAFLRSTRALRT